MSLAIPTSTTSSSFAGTDASSAASSALSFVGRALIALMFVPSGLSKISGFAGTVGYIGAVGLPLPMAGATLAILVEVLGGLALLTGFRTRWAALALAAFTLAASVFFHAFWSLPTDQVMVQQLMFFKNIAITGGLLALAAFGPGAWSLDARRRAQG